MNGNEDIKSGLKNVFVRADLWPVAHISRGIVPVAILNYRIIHIQVLDSVWQDNAKPFCGFSGRVFSGLFSFSGAYFMSSFFRTILKLPASSSPHKRLDDASGYLWKKNQKCI